jgi:hypothetical protein
MRQAVAARPRQALAFTVEGPYTATIALAGLLLATAAVLLYAGQHLTFFYDEWDFILGRRGSSIGTYLHPHNGHLSLFPVVVYKILLSIFGLRHYLPYRVVSIALHLLGSGLLYVLVRRRIGPWLALVATAILLFMGTAYQDLLWPFQISYLGSVAGGLGALALLERPGARRDGWVAALLILSLSSSGVGIAFLVACAVLLIAQRVPLPRLWVVVVPALLFAAWYIGWGSGEGTSAHAIANAPQYVANAAGGAVAGIAGLSASTWGAPLLVGLAFALFFAWRSHRPGGPTPLLLAAGAGALAFWTLSAIARAGFAEPTASRYLYIGAVFILLICAEARLGTGLRGAWLLIAAILLAGALIGNLRMLRDGERQLRSQDAVVRASLGVVEIAAPVVDPTFVAEPGYAPQIPAGHYLSAIRDFGSSALTAPELVHASESMREHSDAVLERAERISVTPVPSTVGRSCKYQPAPSDLALSPGQTLLLRAAPGPVTPIYVRRFAGAFSAVPFTGIAGGTGGIMRFPADRATALPWHIRAVTARRVKACIG